MSSSAGLSGGNSKLKSVRSPETHFPGIGALSVSMALLLLVGCGKSDDASPKLGEVNPPPAEPKQTVVAVVSPALTSIFHVEFVRGAKEEGEKLGYKVESLAADRETNFSAQVDIVESLVRRKVDAITICAINDKAIVGAVEKANEAGIPVFIHCSLVDLPGGEVQAYVGFNQQQAGKLCAEYAVSLLEEKHGAQKGKVYILEGIPGFHSKERVTGFLSVLDGYPEIEVVGQTPANWERQQGMNVASSAMTAHPDLDLFFACSDAMAQGAAQAVQESEKEVFTLGIDGNPDTLKDIEAGVVTASCANFPDEMGRIAMRTINAHLSGATHELKVETPLKMIDRSNVGEMLNR